ncbi:MAG: competence/damage-inducible protein A [Verrucomicrobiota bacterium]|jgi:nicotinamide-nucleotide amidase|nr:competence/damage-inducible protein A [Verrucomicrobiota bacterium]
MHIELINTGSELLLGQTSNTHQAWIANQLADAGYQLAHQCTVNDTGPAIQEALKSALGRADLIITTGGLGPTSDDRTRDDLAELLDRELVSCDAITEHIRAYFERRGKRMPEQVNIQSMLPEGAAYWINQHGTAPGLQMAVDPNAFSQQGRPAWIVMLPGPPRELHPMFRNQFMPWLCKVLPRQQAHACRILRTSGIGESWVEARLSGKLKGLVEAGLDVGYCARTGQVDIRFVAEGPDAESIVRQASEITYEDLGARIYGEGNASLEAALVEACRQKQWQLALAESCTGGCIAHRITNVPGASSVLHTGVVSYANEAKTRLLGVAPATLQAHGAVSEATAREMALGVLKASGADLGLAVTGIAGPSGGSNEKPVGTVFMAIADAHEVQVVCQRNAYDRETFKSVTANQALEWLRRKALGLSLEA